MEVRRSSQADRANLPVSAQLLQLRRLVQALGVVRVLQLPAAAAVMLLAVLRRSDRNDRGSEWNQLTAGMFQRLVRLPVAVQDAVARRVGHHSDFNGTKKDVLTDSGTNTRTHPFPSLDPTQTINAVDGAKLSPTQGLQRIMS